MTMPTRSRVLALVLLLPLLGLLPARAEPSRAFQLEARIPASTLAFVSLERIDTWARRMDATAIGKLMADEEMKAFLAPVVEAVEQLVKGGMMEVPPLLIEAFEQLQGLEGQIAVALVDLDARGRRPSLVASLDFGDKVDDFLEFLRRVQAEVDPSGSHLKTSTRDGRTWWEVDTGQFPIVATTVDTAFVLATDPALLERVVAGGAASSLAASESFLAVQRRAGGSDIGIFAYGNVASALEKFGDKMPRDAQRITSALGLDTVQAVAYAMAFKGDGFRDTLMIHAPAADHGLVPMLEMKPLTAPRTLDLAPAGSFYWSEGSLPFDSLVARIRSLVSSVDPDATEQIDAVLAQGGQVLGVDVEKELLGGLRGSYGAYAAFPATGGLYPEVAVILEVKDPAAYEGTFDRFTQALAGLLNEEGDVLASTRAMDYHGVTMHLFEMQAARGDDVVPFTPTWALIGDRLVVTLVPYAMKEVILRAQGVTTTPGLASKEDFQALMALKPADAGGMEYLNLKAGLGLVYDTLVPLIQTVAKPNVLKDLPLPLDWAQLPPASRVSKHFRSMASFVTWNQDGLVISMQGPIPLLPALAAAIGVGAAMWTRSASVHMDRALRVAEAVPTEDIDSEMDLELAKIQAEMLVEAVEFFRVERGSLPGSLDVLVKEGLMGTIPEDPWGGTYRMRKTGSGFVVESAGPDRQYGTSDDVRVEK